MKKTEIKMVKIEVGVGIRHGDIVDNDGGNLLMRLW